MNKLYTRESLLGFTTPQSHVQALLRSGCVAHLSLCFGILKDNQLRSFH